MKIFQYKLNAVMAKARAIYGQRLTQKDYESLVNASSVAEITAYLKSNSYYSETLEKLPSPDIGAEHLEFLIRKSESGIFERLCRYEMAFGQDIYNYFVKKSEITQILLQMRSIISGKANSGENVKNRFYSGKTEIDMYALSSASSVEEILNVIDATPYKEIVEKCYRSGNNEYIDYECAFINFFHEYEYALVKKCCGKKSGLLTLLSEEADLEFIKKLYRMKKYFPAYSDRILRSIIPMNLTRLTKKEIKELLSIESEKQLADILKKTVYREYAGKIADAGFTEQQIAERRYEKYKHLLRFSTDPNEILFCFMFLIETEAANLIHIIEGVKYKMDYTSIKELLIGAGD